jgi:hypothetical protein
MLADLLVAFSFIFGVIAVYGIFFLIIEGIKERELLEFIIGAVIFVLGSVGSWGLYTASETKSYGSIVETSAIPTDRDMAIYDNVITLRDDSKNYTIRASIIPDSLRCNLNKITLKRTTFPNGDVETKVVGTPCPAPTHTRR